MLVKSLDKLKSLYIMPTAFYNISVLLALEKLTNKLSRQPPKKLCITLQVANHFINKEIHEKTVQKTRSNNQRSTGYGKNQISLPFTLLLANTFYIVIYPIPTFSHHSHGNGMTIHQCIETMSRLKRK